MIGRFYGKCSQVAKAWAVCNWLQRLISRYRSGEGGGGLYKYKYTVLCLKVVFMNSYILRLKKGPFLVSFPNPLLRDVWSQAGNLSSRFHAIKWFDGEWDPFNLLSEKSLSCMFKRKLWGTNKDLKMQGLVLLRCKSWPSLATTHPVHRLTDCIDPARFLEGGFEGDCQCVTLYAVYLVFV